MKLAAVGIASLLLLLALAAAVTAGAVKFEVTNNARTTPGGQRFDQDYGVSYAAQVLSDASSFAWEVFDQTSPADRQPIVDVTLMVNAMVDYDDAAYTLGSTITLNAGYLNDYTGDDVETELTGVLYHETVYVWQWGMHDYGAHPGIFEGIADYVRRKAGYAPGHWVQPGQGDRWDQGYDVTARFLDYCDSLKPGFVALLNAKMKGGYYSDDFFAQILGKTVQQLWQDYKAKYGHQ